MATIRNLLYQNSIVEQPIYDGTQLTKWIHDGVVVWENGLAPLYFQVLSDGSKIICLNAADKTVKSVQLPSYCDTPRIAISDVRNLDLILFYSYRYGDFRDRRWFTQNFELNLPALNNGYEYNYDDIYEFLVGGESISGYDVFTTGYIDGSHMISINNNWMGSLGELEINYDLYPFHLILTTENLYNNESLFPTTDDNRANSWTFDSTKYYSPNFYGKYFKDTSDRLVWSAIPDFKIGHPHIPYMIKINSNGIAELCDYHNIIGRLYSSVLANTDHAYMVKDKFIFKVRSGGRYYIYTTDKNFSSLSSITVSKKVYYSYPIATHKGYTYLYGLGGETSGGGWSDTDYFLVTSDFIYFAEYKYSEITRTIPLINPSTGEQIDTLTVNLGQMNKQYLQRSRMAIDNHTSGLICYYGQNNEYLVYFEDYMFGSPNNFAVRVADIT